MFGKLIKHELKQTFPMVSTIYIILAIVAAFLLLSTLVGATLFKALAYIVLFFATFVMLIMTIAAIFKNFNETLFGRQGYLSLTLPVKGSQLLISKTIVAIIWMLAALVLLAVVNFIMYLSVTGENGIEILSTIQEMIGDSGISELLPSKTAMAKVLVFGIVALFLILFSIVAQIYFSIAIANTRPFQSHTTAFTIISFLLVEFVEKTISQPLNEKFPLALHLTQNDVVINFTSMAESQEMFSYGIAGIIFRTIIAVILLVLTGWILENKVNIK